MLVLHALLEGISGVKKVSEHTGLDAKLTDRLLNSVRMGELYKEAQANITQSAVNRLQGGVHQNIKILEDLRKNQDPRVRMEAARDLLNRTPGMAPGARIDIGPEKYRKAVERYLKAEDDG